MRLRTPIFALAAALLFAASSDSRLGRVAGDTAAAAGQQSSQQPTPQPQPTPQRQRVTPAPQPSPEPLLTPQPAQSPRPTPARPQAVDEDEVLNVDTSIVNVLFNAVDRDRRYVTTLRREDVRVFENEAPQEITAFQHETNLPISIAIVIDVSFSQIIALPDEQQAAKRFVESILRPGGDEVAVLSFSGTTTVEQDLTNDAAELRRAIDNVVIEPQADDATNYEYNMGEQAEVPPVQNDVFGLPGSTALWDAVWATSTELMARAPRNARRAVVVLSDGDDSTSRVRREEAVAAAVKANTVVYAIGFKPDCPGCKLEKKELRRLAEETGGRAFFPEMASEFNTAFGQIEHELRTQYLLSYVPANRERDGSFRRIRLEITSPELKKRKIKLTYREGYYALPPRPREPRRLLDPTQPQYRLRRPPRPPLRPRKN